MIDDRRRDKKHPLDQISDTFKCRHRVLRWAGAPYDLEKDKEVKKRQKRSTSSSYSQTGFWTWQRVHYTPTASAVTRPQSNRSALRCGGTVDSHHRHAADRTVTTVWCYDVNNIASECIFYPLQRIIQRQLHHCCQLLLIFKNRRGLKDRFDHRKQYNRSVW